MSGHVTASNRNDTATASEWMVTATSGANAAVTATQAASGTATYYVCSIAASFSAAPAAFAVMQVKDGTTVIWEGYVGTQPWLEDFAVPLRCTAGNLASITLAAGGAAIVGKVSICGYTD